METVALQLVTLVLDDGTRGIFVGWPLISENKVREGSQVEDIWFSNIQEIPLHLTLEQLMELMRKQMCSCAASLQ